jgi:hypothetical protein
MRGEEYWQHYQNSRSLQATADFFGVSKSAVVQALKRSGYPVQARGRRKSSDKTPAQLNRERVRRYRQRLNFLDP